MGRWRASLRLRLAAAGGADPQGIAGGRGAFMHPVKARHAIHAAYHEHGVTDFAFDSADELQKILQETVPVGLVGEPLVLGFFVRLAVGQGGAYDLSGKFGVSVAEAAE